MVRTLAADAEPFGPSPMTKPVFSLRDRIVAAGITDEALIRKHLACAHNVIRLVPGINIRRYNVAAPMSGVSSG